MRVMMFSEYCLEDENISVQPERLNTPGIFNLDAGIDLSGISFIQSEINKTYELKYAPVDGDGYCLLRAILVLKQHDYSWALGSHKTQKEVYEEFIKIVDKPTIEALVDAAFCDLRKMLRHYLALICNLTTKFRVWVVLCHGAFCFKRIH